MAPLGHAGHVRQGEHAVGNAEVGRILLHGSRKTGLPAAGVGSKRPPSSAGNAEKSSIAREVTAPGEAKRPALVGPMPVTSS